MGGGPHRPSVDGIGPVLRVASWNIERGSNFDLIKLALSDPEGFKKAALERGALDAGKQMKIEQQLRTLRDADIIVLNEVDLGMKRTDYRDVTRDLAHALGMNYVFGVEFVEVDRLDDLGLENIQLDDPALTQQIREEPRRRRVPEAHRGRAADLRPPGVAPGQPCACSHQGLRGQVRHRRAAPTGRGGARGGLGLRTRLLSRAPTRVLR